MGHISFADGYEVMKEYGSPFSPELMDRYNLIPQGLSAEMIADKWEIPRSELDELGLRSQQLAAKATEEGRFEREIDPLRRQRRHLRRPTRACARPRWRAWPD